MLWLLFFCTLAHGCNYTIRNFYAEVHFEDKICAVHVHETMEVFPRHKIAMDGFARVIPVEFFPKSPVSLDSVLVHEIYNVSFTSTVTSSKDAKTIYIQFAQPQSERLFIELEYRLRHAQREVDGLYSFHWDVFSKLTNAPIDVAMLDIYVTTPNSKHIKFLPERCEYNGQTDQQNEYLIKCADLDLKPGWTFPVQVSYVPFDYKSCRENGNTAKFWGSICFGVVSFLLWLCVCWVFIRLIAHCCAHRGQVTDSPLYTPLPAPARQQTPLRFDIERYGSTEEARRE
jgi:hypothetical protein